MSMILRLSHSNANAFSFVWLCSQQVQGPGSDAMFFRSCTTVLSVTQCYTSPMPPETRTFFMSSRGASTHAVIAGLRPAYCERGAYCQIWLRPIMAWWCGFNGIYPGASFKSDHVWVSISSRPNLRERLLYRSVLMALYQGLRGTKYYVCVVL